MQDQVRDRVDSAVELLDQWLAFRRWFLELPSMAVGISLGDETVLATGYGYADVGAGIRATQHTKYRIASHSKVFTATALVRLAADGVLQLDDPVARHLDWFRSTTHPDVEHITIRQLLSHSSGITRDGDTTHWHDDEFPELDEIIRQVESGMQVFGAIEKLKYSNVGLTIAGQIIEAATGRSYADHIQATILDPLGLDATSSALPSELDGHAVGYPPRLPGRGRPPIEHIDARVMDSATGYSSTVVDLLRWYRAHRFGTGELLPDRWKREMQRVQFEGPDTRWGLGFSLPMYGGLEFCTHGGGYPGFITYSGLNQEHGLAIVVLTNSIDGPAMGLFDAIAKVLSAAISGEFDRAPDDPPADLDSVRAASGFYENRWRFTQLATLGESAVTLPPTLPDPMVGMAALKPTGEPGDLRFTLPDRIPTGSPGEVLSLELGDPPQLRFPAGLAELRVDLPFDEAPW